MDVALVNNPDGSAAVVIQADKPRTRPARVYPPMETKSEPNFKCVTNPFEELEQTHMENLKLMQKQDAAARAEHKAADPELSKLFQQDAAEIATYETFVTYNAKAPVDDHAIRAAVATTDAAVLRAVAAVAAGPNPILSPPPSAANVATPGMDWLERMRAEDAALQNSVAQNDALLKSP